MNGHGTPCPGGKPSHELFYLNRTGLHLKKIRLVGACGVPRARTGKGSLHPTSSGGGDEYTTGNIAFENVHDE